MLSMNMQVLACPPSESILRRLKELDFTGEQLLALDNQVLSQICFPEKIKSGETIMIDFTGKKLNYTDPSSGEIMP